MASKVSSIFQWLALLGTLCFNILFKCNQSKCVISNSSPMRAFKKWSACQEFINSKEIEQKYKEINSNVISGARLKDLLLDSVSFSFITWPVSFIWPHAPISLAGERCTTPSWWWEHLRITFSRSSLLTMFLQDTFLWICSGLRWHIWIFPTPSFHTCFSNRLVSSWMQSFALSESNTLLTHHRHSSSSDISKMSAH